MTCLAGCESPSTEPAEAQKPAQQQPAEFKKNTLQYTLNEDGTIASLSNITPKE